MLHTVCCPLTGITICGDSNMLKCVYFIYHAKYEKNNMCLNIFTVWFLETWCELLPDILYKYKTELFATISNFQDETYIFLAVSLYFKVLQYLTLWSACRNKIEFNRIERIFNWTH